MHKRFRTALTNFLDSEATDYFMGYEILGDTYDELSFPSVTVKIFIDNESCVVFEEFAWTTHCCNQTGDSLCLEMGEDHWEHVCEYSWEVKYFWMKVAPHLFTSEQRSTNATSKR